MDKRRDDVCGCGGSGSQRGLGHLIDMLERKQPVNQAEVETGEYPALGPEKKETRSEAKPDGAGNNCTGP